MKPVFFTLTLLLLTMSMFGADIISTTAGGNWSNPATWEIGVVPTIGDNVTIVNGATVVVDQDFDIQNIIIDGTLIIGNNLTGRNVVIRGTTTINPSGSLLVGNFNISHNITFYDSITNDGVLDLHNSSNQVANAFFSGTFTISGSAIPQFAKATFSAGILTTAVSLDINGAVVIENGATFSDGNLTHNVAGNWTVNGTGQMTGSGTIIMDAQYIQSITTSSTFYNLSFSGGAVGVLAAQITVNNDFNILNNTEVQTTQNHSFFGNFSVEDGCKFTASDGQVTFGANSNQQIINIGTTNSFPNITFFRLYLDNGAPVYDKLVNGNLQVSSTLYIFDDAIFNDLQNTYSHTFSGDGRIDGIFGLNSDIIIKGGTWYDNNDNNFRMGNSNLTIQGTVYIGTNNTMQVNGNVSIIPNENNEHTALVINNNAQLLNIDGTGVITVTDNTSLYLRGVNNFPNTFTNVDFQSGSYARYDAALANQNIYSGVSYWNLYLNAGSTKTALGNLDVNGNIWIYNATNFLLQNFNHTFAGNIYNNDDANGHGSITATGGSVTLDADNADQTIYPNGSGNYVFHNLYLTNSAPTVVRNKYFNDNITINGSFSATNSGGNATLMLNVYLYENIISGGVDFTLGDFVRLLSSGTNTFQTTIESFSGGKNFGANSTVRFNRDENNSFQSIPGGFSYGNIELYGNTIKNPLSDLDINGSVSNAGRSPVFTANSYTINVGGNWELSSATTNLSGTNVIVFDGANQTISQSNFNHVTFSGTATKRISGSLDILKNITIQTGVTVNADNQTIYIEGNWSEIGTGRFSQNNTGTVVFDGTTSNQTIQTNAASNFYNFTINKTEVNKTITLNSNIDINGTISFAENSAILNLNGRNMSVAGDFYFRNGCSFNHGGGKVIFDGSAIAQLIRNYNSSTIVFNDVDFSGPAVKRLSDNSFRFQGDVTIINTILDGQTYVHYVEGNWFNDGIFRHTSTLYFNGSGNQTISQSSFYSVRFAGAGTTKTLTGNISLGGNLFIDDATLDVSPASYNITLDNNWYNNSTGSFIARQGTVIFNGEYSTLYTGESNTQYAGGTFLTSLGGIKSFYNLTINMRSNEYYILLRGDLHISNNFIINNGDFRQSDNPVNYGINDISVGGDYICKGLFRNNDYGETFTLNPTTGSHIFSPSNTNTYGILVFDGVAGTSYIFGSNLNMLNNRAITINNGDINLNGNKITTNGALGNITLNSGSLTVNENATISMGNNATFTNAGGVFQLIGENARPASLIATSGNYNFIQTSGTIHANNYRIVGTRANGINLQGGSIDDTNSFQSGSFSGGIGTSYLTATGINLGADRIIPNVTFNNGPTFNVQRTSGTGAMILENADGTLAGEEFDNDNGNPGTLINWTYPGAKLWTGLGDGTSWNDANNWVPVGIPTNTTVVILDHSNIPGSYTVRLNSADNGVAKSVCINSGGNTIALLIDGRTLTIDDNLTISANSILTQTNPSDIITLGGSWANLGTFNSGTSSVVFKPIAGTRTITTKGAADPFYNFIINGTVGVNVVSSDIYVNNNVVLQTGTLNASNYTIFVSGDWTRNGSAVFNVGTGTVDFHKTGNQTINGGEFYNLTTSGSGTKTASANIDIKNNVFINSGTILNGGINLVNVGGNWTNLAGITGFSQSGNGTVFFNGTIGTQSIGAGSSLETTFNNVVMSGTAKTIEKNININGYLTITSGLVYVLNTVDILGLGTDNTFSMSGGSLYLRGHSSDNSNNFPKNFENINLSAGNVMYQANFNQTIYPTAYYNLYVLRENPNQFSTKTMTGNITVNNNLYVNDIETLLNANDNTVFLWGTISFPTGGRQIVWGTNGTVDHFGENWTVDADIEGFNNVIKRNRGYLNIEYSNLIFTGNLSILEDAYLRQATVNITCTGVGKTFTLAPTAYVTSLNPESLGGNSGRKAFPVGFSTYNLHPNSRVYISGTTGNQTIYCVPNYGNLYINTTAQINVHLDGNLDVDGSFTMSNEPTLIDNGYNLNLGGPTVDIRKYTPTGSSTITFDGANQNIYDAGNGATVFDMINVVFAGTGTKNLQNNADDWYKVTGNLTINPNVKVNIPRRLDYSGSNWINNGIFSSTAQMINFIGNNQQTINPGSDNIFYAVSFSGTGIKTFSQNGINIGNGALVLDAGAEVNMSNLTHRIASERITNNGAIWITQNANFIFDRNGTQYLPPLVCNDLVFRCYDQWDRIRYLEGAITVNDFTIESRTQLRCSLNDEITTPTYNVTVFGNFTNNGILYAWGNTFFFESNNSDSKDIKQGSGSFHNVMFNQSGINTRLYRLIEDTRIYEELTIGNQATLKLNGHSLFLGNDDPNDPVEPTAEVHTIQTGGTLDVDGGASLIFSCRDIGNTQLNVNGTLKIVGENGNNATITSNDWHSNSLRIDININNGGRIHARYYLMKYLSNNGFYIATNASIDPVENFSDGTWSDMNTSTASTYTYLYCNADATGLNPIDNVIFNFAGNPTIGRHFNIKRDATSVGILNLGGSCGGLLSGNKYEADPVGENNTGTSLINWAPVSDIYWTGNINTDWFIADNWTPAQVPTNATNAIIPIRSNNPIITGQNAVCKDLRIIDGFLTIQPSWSINVNADIFIGIGTSVGILAVEDASSTISVSANWTRGQNGVFIHGNGTVEFNASAGSVSIDPRTSPFGNVVLNGDATFMINRTETFIDRNLTISNGVFQPIVNSYLLHIKGDYNNNGGSFDNTIRGTILFDNLGDQNITNADFWNVIIKGSGNKTVQDSCVINGNLTVNGGLLVAGCPIYFNNYVTIESSGGFVDGNLTHSFKGYRWNGLGSYSGNGTIQFEREAYQEIGISKFNNLLLRNTGGLVLLGNVDVTGNVTVTAPNTSLNVNTHQLTNTSGNGTLTLTEARYLYVRGANNFPSGFSNYNFHRTSYTYYDGTVDQTIASFPVTYGRLYLDNSAKTAAGNLDINGILYFYNDASLDVTENNYRINLESHWYNENGATFYPRQGEVVFDGNDANSNLYIYEPSKQTNPFYKLTINKGSGQVYSAWTDITVLNNLRVINGIFNTSRTVYVGGDMAALSGTFAPNGTYYLNKSTGNSNLQLNGSVLNNLTINSSATYNLQDNLLMNGIFNQMSGTFDANGKVVRMGNYGEVNEISGLYIMGAGGMLQLPNYGTLNVNAGGEIWVVGDADNVATVTNYEGRYYFNIENGGSIRARNYLFEYMAENGIYIKNGATINNEYNFSFGTFTNAANGGACLRIENNQNFTDIDGNPIVEVSFPLNPGGGAANVRKSNTSSGVIDFKDYYGVFGGEDFDHDPAELINWISPPYIMWTGNIDNDWYKPGNWQVISGPERIPLSNDNVVITKRTNQPVINTGGAVAKTIDVQVDAVLTLSTSATNGITLTVFDDITFDGMIIMASNYDTLTCGGNWSNRGLFSAGEGTVILNSVFGIKTLNNGNHAFYNLFINSVTEVQLLQNLTIDNNFRIINGIFDLSSDNRLLTVKGDFINSGTFNSRAAKVILAGKSLTQIFNPGNSAFFNIDVNATPITNILLTDNPLYLSHNMNVNSGIFSLNHQRFYFGDASGTDVLTIIGGTLLVNGGAYLLPANLSSIEVNDGGIFRLIGDNFGNPANIQSQSGNYNFNVNNGGTIQALYYTIDNLNANGLRIKSGAIISETENFSYGIWRNGTPTGQYLWLENDFTNFTIVGNYFHEGAGFNVKRIEGNGIVTFEDALGLRAGHLFEIDNPTNGAETGFIRWTFTHDLYIWTGNINQDWNIPENWDVPVSINPSGHAVPNQNSIACIPDVSLGSGNNPILGFNTGDANGMCYDLRIEQGGFLTIRNDKNLDIDNSVTILSGGRFTIEQGSVTNINVADAWLVNGIFEHGNSSTVIFDSPVQNLLSISGSSNFFNLHINSLGLAEYNTSSTINIDGNFSITNGLFTVLHPNDSILVKGNFSNAGTYNHGDGVVILNGANQNIHFSGNGSFNKLVCRGSNNKNITSDIIIRNDLEIFSNVTLNGNSHSISLYGDWINRGIFEPFTSTILLIGSGNQIIDNYNAETFYNLVINNTSSTFPQVVLYGDLSLNGNNWTMNDGVIETTTTEMLTIGQNVVLTGGNNEASYVNGPITKIGNSNFVFPIGDGTKFARLGIADLNSSSTFVAQYFEEPYSDIVNIGAGLNHVSGYEHWTLHRNNGSAEPIVTFYWEDGAQSGIDNPVTLTTAIYTSGQWENMGNGNTTGTYANGTITSGLPFTQFGPCGFASINDIDNPLQSYTSWTGLMSTAWNNPNNWTIGVPTETKDASISSAPVNQPIIDIDANVRRLIIEQGASLVVNPIRSLTIHGRLFINGSLVLGSDENGNANLINLNSISYNENCSVTTQLYLSGWRYHHIASPTTITNSEIFKSIPFAPHYNHNFYYYNESGATWEQLGTDWIEFDGNMTPMTGYTYYGDRNITARIERGNNSNNFNVGDFSKTLYYTAATESDVVYRGWNFVGNPYPSNIDWSHPDWIKNNIYNSIYFWNGTNYSYFVAGDNAQNNGMGVNDGTGIIPSMQGYFVKVKENLTPEVNQTGLLVTPVTARTTTTQAFWKKNLLDNNDEIDVIRLTVLGNGKSDETAIRFVNNATPVFDDMYDAFKLFPGNWYGIPQIYSLIENTNCAINSLPEAFPELVINIGFNAPSAGEYTISAKDFNLSIGNDDVYFVDLLTNQTYNLENLVYSFTSEAGNFINRFIIKFKNSTTSIFEPEFASIPFVQIYSSSNRLNFYSETGDAILGNVSIYNSVGQKIMEFRNNQQNNFSKQIDLANGVYIIRLNSKYGVITKKVSFVY